MDYSVPQALEKLQMRAQAFSQLCHLSDRSSKKKSLVINLLPQSFINRGRDTFIAREKSGPHHIQTDYHTYDLFF